MYVIDRKITNEYQGRIEVLTLRVPQWTAEFELRFDTVESPLSLRKWRFFVGVNELAGHLIGGGTQTIILVNTSYKNPRMMVTDLLTWAVLLRHATHEYVLPFLEDTDVDLHTLLCNYLEAKGVPL